MGIFNQKVKLHAPTRNWFDLSHSNTMSLDMGAMTCTMSKLFPAGAKLKGSIEHIVRMNPMDAPVFQRFEMYHDIFAYPLHLVWKDAYQYFRGGNNGNTDYPFPTLRYDYLAAFTFALRTYQLYGSTLTNTNFSAKPNVLQGSLLDYLGYPTYDDTIETYLDTQNRDLITVSIMNTIFQSKIPMGNTQDEGSLVSVLPIACYQGIYREYYRDQFIDVYEPYDTPNVNFGGIAWSKYVPECDIFDYLSGLATRLNSIFDVETQFTLQEVVTMIANCVANPASDGGLSRLIEFLSTRNVCFSRDYFTAVLPNAQLGNAVQIPFTGVISGTSINSRVVAGKSGSINPVFSTDGGATTSSPSVSGNIVNANTIPDLRKANRLQEFLEKSALGNRIYDFFKIHFGVESSDARLQIPHLIARLRSTFSISEVTQTSSTTSQFALGDYAGHGVNVDKDFAMNYTFEEPTYVMVITSIRPKQAYYQGIKRELITTDRFDHIIPEFAEIGMQPVYKKELLWNSNTMSSSDIFGYIDRYGDSKQMTDEVHGDFRGSLLYWHDSRQFSGTPALNSSFLHIQPASQGLNRIFAYEGEDYNHFFMLMQFNLSCELPLPYYPNYRM